MNPYYACYTRIYKSSLCLIAALLASICVAAQSGVKAHFLGALYGRWQYQTVSTINYTIEGEEWKLDKDEKDISHQGFLEFTPQNVMYHYLDEEKRLLGSFNLGELNSSCGGYPGFEFKDHDWSYNENEISVISIEGDSLYYTACRSALAEGKGTVSEVTIVFARMK